MATKKVQEASANIPLTAQVYGLDGTKGANISLPESVFGVKWNADLVHQVVVSMQANARVSTAHTKMRGEVSGGGKKPWRQKGTGRARHGSTRSPIWRGGGITFGPRSDKDYSKKISKKMRSKALAVVLSKKLADGEILFVDHVSFTAPKTKDAAALIGALAKGADAKALVEKKKNAALFAVAAPNEAVKKSFRNLSRIEVEEVRNLNPVDVLSHTYLIIENPSEAIAALEARMNA